MNAPTNRCLLKFLLSPRLANGYWIVAFGVFTKAAMPLCIGAMKLFPVASSPLFP